MAVKQLYRCTASGMVSSNGVGPPPSFVLGVTKPDATNTGVPGGVVLTNFTGDYTVNVAGTVLDSLRITGRVLVRAANVTIRNCEILGNGYAGGNSALIDCNHSAVVNCVIEDNLLHQSTADGTLWIDAVIGHDYTARYNNCYNVVDGFGVYNSNSGSTAGNVNVIIEANYVHDLCYFSPDPNHSDGHTHNDGVQIQGGTGGVIRGNAISINVSTTMGQPGSDSYAPAVTGQCITMSPNVSAISNYTIDSNWLDYGSRGLVAITGGKGAANLGSCTNNRFGSHLHAPTTYIQIDQTGGLTWTTFSGNTDPSGSFVPLLNGTG